MWLRSLRGKVGWRNRGGSLQTTGVDDRDQVLSLVSLRRYPTGNLGSCYAVELPERRAWATLKANNR